MLGNYAKYLTLPIKEKLQHTQQDKQNINLLSESKTVLQLKPAKKEKFNETFSIFITKEVCRAHCMQPVSPFFAVRAVNQDGDAICSP